MKKYLTLDQQVSPWQVYAEQDVQYSSDPNKNELKESKILKKANSKKRTFYLKNQKLSQQSILAYQSQKFTKEAKKVNRKCQSEIQIKKWKKIDITYKKVKTQHVQQNNNPAIQRKQILNEKLYIDRLNELLQKCKSRRHIENQIFRKRQILTIKSVEKMKSNKNLLLPKIQLCTIQK